MEERKKRRKFVCALSLTPPPPPPHPPHPMTPTPPISSSFLVDKCVCWVGGGGGEM